MFVEGESVPKEIFEVYSDSLPESDREALKSGISARDDAELQRLIEDYTS